MDQKLEFGHPTEKKLRQAAKYLKVSREVVIRRAVEEVMARYCEHGSPSQYETLEERLLFTSPRLYKPIGDITAADIPPGLDAEAVAMNAPMFKELCDAWKGEDDKFALIVRAAPDVLGLSFQDLAQMFELAASAFARYAKGTAIPRPRIQRYIVNKLGEHATGLCS